MQRHPRHAEIRKAHAEVDPVRRNSPQSDQTGESFLLTGRFRNYLCEVCEFPPGRPVAYFIDLFLSERFNFRFTTISPRFTYGGSILEGTRETHRKRKRFRRRGEGEDWDELDA